jgi:hypothetical protein
MDVKAASDTKKDGIGQAVLSGDIEERPGPRNSKHYTYRGSQKDDLT